MYLPTRIIKAARPLVSVQGRSGSFIKSRAFAFYRGPHRQPDVVVETGYTLPLVPADRTGPQRLCVELKAGLSEEQYKNVAEKVETLATVSIAEYERGSQVQAVSGVHLRGLAV